MSRRDGVPQVRIQLPGADGEWRTPSQAPAALAALRVIACDISEYPASYADGDLSGLRAALAGLGDVISAQAGAPGRGAVR